MNYVCSPIFTPLSKFVQCASPFDWTVAVVIAAICIGPVISFSILIVKWRSK